MISDIKNKCIVVESCGSFSVFPASFESVMALFKDHMPSEEIERLDESNWDEYNVIELQNLLISGIMDCENLSEDEKTDVIKYLYGKSITGCFVANKWKEIPHIEKIMKGKTSVGYTDHAELDEYLLIKNRAWKESASEHRIVRRILKFLNEHTHRDVGFELADIGIL